MVMLKNNPTKVNKCLEWYSEDRMIKTRQMLTSIFESEGHSMSKIDHPMYFRRRFLKSRLINEEVNELRTDESSQKNQDYIQKLFPDCVDEYGCLRDKKVIEILSKIPGNLYSYKFSKDPLNGPVLIMYAKRKLVFTIRVNEEQTVPICMCVSAYTECTKTGSPLPPEGKSKYRFFRSINDYGIHAMNTYISYDEVPILPLMEWCRNFANFCEKKCKITNNRLYWSQKFQFMPTDFCSVELKENDLIHKSSHVFK